MNNVDLEHWYRVYRACDEATAGTPAEGVARTINRAARQVMDTVSEAGFRIRGDDIAERMVAALTAYLFVSNSEALSVIPTQDDD